jgi:phenylalanyl-tRNA synthetase beta chain
MKFSYPLLKKLAPTTPSKAAAIELLTLHAFEAEDVGRQKIDVSLPPNRYADCASHRGIARELAAIQNTKVGFRDTRIVNPPRKGVVRVAVRTTACPRYAAYYFRLGRHPATPKWMKNVLAACGLRPINLIVDITNYVMI